MSEMPDVIYAIESIATRKIHIHLEDSKRRTPYIRKSIADELAEACRKALNYGGDIYGGMSQNLEEALSRYQALTEKGE